MIGDRHNQESVFKSWAAPGIFSYSSDALVTGQFGFQSGSDLPSTFPNYICKEGLCPKFLDYVGVLGIGLPDMVTRPAPGLGSRFRLIPEKDYPDALSIPHNKRAGDFDFNFLVGWSAYWAERAKQIAFEHFGTVRPRPELHPDYAFRLVYVAAHRGFQIQRAFRPGSTVDWQQFDTSTGSPTMHLSFNDVISLVFDGNSIDHPPSVQLYACDTVLGIHPPVNTAYNLNNYSYAGFAHKHETGSFAFNTVGCGGQQCDDPGTAPAPQPRACECTTGDVQVGEPLYPSEGRPDGIDIGSSDVGYCTARDTGLPVAGTEGIYLENWVRTNRKLVELITGVCAVLCELKNIREMQAFYLQQLSAKKFDVDTKPIEDAIKAGNTIMDNAFFTTITQS